jgi:hypothetical protein
MSEKKSRYVIAVADINHDYSILNTLNMKNIKESIFDDTDSIDQDNKRFDSCDAIVIPDHNNYKYFNSIDEAKKVKDLLNEIFNPKDINNWDWEDDIVVILEVKDIKQVVLLDFYREDK